MFKLFRIFDVKSTIFRPKPQHSKSFYPSFRPMHIVSSLFGISYFHRLHSVSKKLASIAYTLAIFILFVVSFLYRITNTSPTLCNANAVSYSVIGIQQILSTIAIVTIYYQVLFYKSQFAHLLELVTLIEHEFVMLNIKCICKRFAMKILCEIIVVIAFFYISLAFFIIYYNVWDIDLIALELFGVINPLLAITLNLMTFINAVWFIRSGFQHIKQFLIDLCAIDSLLLADGHSNEVWTVKLMIKMPSELFCKYKQIARIYELLFEMADHLNDIFGLSNLASMGKYSFGKLQVIYFFKKKEYACKMSIFFWFVCLFRFRSVALFSITLTSYLFLLFKLLTESTNNMNDIQFEVIGIVCDAICHTLINIRS